MHELFYGCLFCKSGTEHSTAAYINQAIDAMEAMVPWRIRKKTVARLHVVDLVPMLPGYVFFRCESPNAVRRLLDVRNVFRILEYSDRTWSLIGSDRKFAELVFEGHLLQNPNVCFIDNKLHFEDGFLFGHDDAVLRVNRRKRMAEIRLGIDQLKFWIGYNERSEERTKII